MVFKRRKNAEAVEGAGTAASSKSSYAKEGKEDNGVCSPLNWILFIIVLGLGASSVINPSNDTPNVRSEAATVEQKVVVEEPPPPPPPTWITGTVNNIDLAALDAAVAGQTNIALNKGTAQIGSYKNDPTNYGSQQAVDGKRDESTTTHSNGECDPWWQVDLAGSFNVQSVAIKNRPPLERLYNVAIEVLNLNGEVWETVAQAVLEDNPAEWVHAVYEKPAKGTVVRIRLDTCECLHMHAVEVYGTPA